MSSCWLFAGEGVLAGTNTGNGQYYALYVCGTSPSYASATGGGLTPVVDGNYPEGTGWIYQSGTATIQQVANTNNPPSGYGVYGGCAACQSTYYNCVSGSCQSAGSSIGQYTSLTSCQASCKAYDCINGSCTQNNVYNTPGEYSTIAACQSACGQENCPSCPACPDPVPCVCPACTCPDPVPCPDCPPCTTGACVCPPAPTCPPATPCVQKTCPPCPPATPCTCPSTNQNNNDVNFSTITVPIFTGDCDDSGNPAMADQSITVIQGLESTELLKFTELANTQGAIACPSSSSGDTAAIIEGWAIRPEYQRPQAIYQFAQVDNSGNYVGAPKYQIVIPHHITTKPTNPLPNYQKGNWLLIYVLNDNSKVTIYAYDETNAMTMLTAIQALIIPTMLTNAYLARSCLVQTATQIAQINVKNRSAKYYSTGAKNAVPDWVVKW